MLYCPNMLRDQENKVFNRTGLLYTLFVDGFVKVDQNSMDESTVTLKDLLIFMVESLLLNQPILANYTCHICLNLECLLSEAKIRSCIVPIESLRESLKLCLGLILKNSLRQTHLLILSMIVGNCYKQHMI